MVDGLDFLYTKSGLSVSFRVIGKVPVKATFDWDFGDDNGEVFNRRHPSYTYSESGFYTVTMHVTNSLGLDVTVTRNIVVCDYGHTTLSDSIYNLIDRYIPEEISDGMSDDDKHVYIDKWQFYIGPLVNHVIPPDKYQDELWYEALENQLIMELAAWDYLNVQLMNLLLSTGRYLSYLTSTKETTGDGESDTEKARGDRIKQITTGPTEVQYYDTLSESTSSLWNYYSNALKPGGLIDELKENLCALAQRLEIYIPFCSQRINRQRVPKVVNKRKPGPLDGPNPTSPIYGGPKDSIL